MLELPWILIVMRSCFRVSMPHVQLSFFWLGIELSLILLESISLIEEVSIVLRAIVNGFLVFSDILLEDMSHHQD